MEWRIHVYGWISCNWNYNWNYRTQCMSLSIEYWSLMLGGMWFWHCAASCVGVRRLASRRVGCRTSACVCACVRGVSGTQHVGLWLRCVCGYEERSPVTCIVAAFAALYSMAGVYKFIMPSSGIRNRVRVRGFFHESVRNCPLMRFWKP